MFPLLDLYIDSFFITLKQMICFQSGSLPLGPRTCYTRQLMTGLPISSLLVWSFCAVKHFEQDQPLWAATALHCPQPTKALLQSCTAELIKPLSARCPRVFGSTPVPSGYHRHIGICPSFSESKRKETSSTNKG